MLGARMYSLKAPEVVTAAVEKRPTRFTAPTSLPHGELESKIRTAFEEAKPAPDRKSVHVSVRVHFALPAYGPVSWKLPTSKLSLASCPQQMWKPADISPAVAVPRLNSLYGAAPTATSKEMPVYPPGLVAEPHANETPRIASRLELAKPVPVSCSTQLVAIVHT
jgi:hypothetical protein